MLFLAGRLQTLPGFYAPAGTLCDHALNKRPRGVAHFLLQSLVLIELVMARRIGFPVADLAV
jgi:hypothetical protein